MKIKQRLLCAATALITIFSTTLGSTSVSAAEGESFRIDERLVRVGDYFLMGTYYGEPILWRCIKTDENGPLMLSDKILCIKAFDARGTNTSGSHGRGYESGSVRKENGSNYWGDSNIRDWLNSDASAGNVVWSCGNHRNFTAM